LNGLWLHAVNETSEPVDGDLRVALYANGALSGEPARIPLTIPARGSRSIHADALFRNFQDLTYAYRFGPPIVDVIASTLRDRVTGEVRAAAHCFPVCLPATRDDDLGLTARLQASADGYSIVLDTKRFAYAVAIDVEGFVPDDNYLHVEPGESTRVRLASAAGRHAVPRGHVSALNDARRTPIAVEESVGAR
jgi:beta-mannosidase